MGIPIADMSAGDQVLQGHEGPVQIAPDYGGYHLIGSKPGLVR
jgi:hypothetical protein